MSRDMQSRLPRLLDPVEKKQPELPLNDRKNTKAYKPRVATLLGGLRRSIEIKKGNDQ